MNSLLGTTIFSRSQLVIVVVEPHPETTPVTLSR